MANGIGKTDASSLHDRLDELDEKFDARLDRIEKSRYTPIWVGLIMLFEGWIVWTVRGWF